MRRRASAAVTGLRKRLSAGSIEPPSVPVFFNLLPDAEMWPKAGRIGEQRLTLVQYWRQMQRGMAPDQGAEVAQAAGSAASQAPPVEQTGQTIYVNGQPLQPSDEPVPQAAPAAQHVTLLGASTIAASSAAEPHTAFKLEDFDDDLDEDRAAPVATQESASVGAPTPASHASTDEIPAAMDSPAAETQPVPVSSVLEAAGILVDPPAAVEATATPAAHVLAFAREPESAEQAAAVAVEAVEVAADAVADAAACEPADAAVPEPAGIVAFEPDLELGSLDGFTDEPAFVQAPDVEISNLAVDAFVVEGPEAFESFESARRVDPEAGGFDAFAVDFLTDSTSDLSAVADSMVDLATHEAALQGSVPDLQLEDLTPAEPGAFEAVAEAEPVDDVSLDVPVLVGERAEPLFEPAADEPIAEAIAEPIVEAVIEDAIAEPAEVMVEAVAESVAEEAAPDPIAESVVAEPVADHAEPLVEMAAPEPHDAGWEQPEAHEAHEAVAAAEFAAPIAADAPSREAQDEVPDVMEVPMPAASASAFVAPLTDDAHGVELHDEDGPEVVDLPAAAASTFAPPLTADATADDHGGDAASAELHLPAALADSAFADVMHAGLDHASAGETPGEGARAAADAPHMPALEADGVWSDAMSEWATTTRDARLRRAGVIPMPSSKPLTVPVVSTRSAIPALERFMRSAQARRRRVSSESVA